MGYLTISNARRYETFHRWHFFFQADSALVHMHCECNTVQLLCLCRLPFSWTMPHNNPELNALITIFRESYSSVRVVSQKTEEIKEQLVEFWQCTDTALEWKMPFSCFPVLPGSAEAQVIWGGSVKRLLTAYFICNISAQKYQNVFMYVKVIANQRWDVFLRHSVVLAINAATKIQPFQACITSNICSQSHPKCHVWQNTAH